MSIKKLKEMDRYELEFKDNKRLGSLENSIGREQIDGFNELFNTTCTLFSTFKGIKGQKIVDTVISLMKTTPELRQFIFDFYYNVKTAGRIRSIYEE